MSDPSSFDDSSHADRSDRFSFPAYHVVLLGLLIGTASHGVLASPATGGDVASRIMGEEIVAENVLAVRRSAASLSDVERFEFLCEWVLPNQNHAGYRISGEYVPRRLPSTIRRDPAFSASLSLDLNAEVSEPSIGGTLVSPVIDLLDVASRLDKLSELRERIRQVQPSDTLERESQLALLALVHQKLRESEQSELSVARLRDSLQEEESPSLARLWPAILVASQFSHSSDPPAAVDDLIALLRDVIFGAGQSGIPKHVQSQIQSLSGLVWTRQWVEERDDSAHGIDDQHWLAISHSNAETRGLGHASPQWVRTADGAVVHLCGSDTDYLIYKFPLRGDYTVEADLSVSQSAQVLNAGQFTGRTEGQIHTGTVAKSAEVIRVPKRNRSLGLWARYRSTVKNHGEQVFLVGKPFRQRQLSPGDEPWVGLRSWYKSTARFRDFRVGGAPAVPDQVLLSHSPSLTGWGSYFDRDGSHWRAMEDDGVLIVGRKRDDLPDSSCERLLRYFRPLDESCRVDFEYFYDPNIADVSPALDRIAWVLTPTGVEEHLVTHGEYDRTTLRPDNLLVIPEHQRHKGSLPLKAKQWNRVSLRLQDRSVTLFLNDQLVYQRPIDEHNDRTFGLFHFADKSAAQVRRVEMRANWPKTMDGLQDFADPIPLNLERGLDKLTSVFTHDFADTEGTAQYFQLENVKSNSSVSHDESGVQLATTSIGGWQQVGVAPSFSLHGDFDVTATFSNASLALDAPMARIAISLTLGDEYQRKLLTAMARNESHGLHTMGSLTLTYPDGTKRYLGARQPDESTSGRLRVARRGDRVYCLMAQGESDIWRLVQQEAASTADVGIGGIELMAIAQRRGTTSVTWKNVTLRAEKLMVFDESQPKHVLSIFSKRGGERREIARPTGAATVLGSPDWSPDERSIAYDQSNGSTTESRLMIVDIEGGEPVDIGFGSMPTFSPDGKQIAFSAAGQGVGIMDRDGSGRRILESRGWGIQWSPHPDVLAFTRGGQLYLWNLRKNESEPLLTSPAADRYSSLYWNMCWSPDGKHIATKGRRATDGVQEIAVFDVNAPSRVRVLLSDHQGSADIGWSSDGQQVILPVGKPADFPQLFAFNYKGGGPEYVSGQPQSRATGVDVSKSGKWIAVAAQADPAPELWQPKPKQPKPKQAGPRRSDLTPPRESK